MDRWWARSPTKYCGNGSLLSIRPHLHFRRQSLRDHGIARPPDKEQTMKASPTNHPNAIIAGGYDHPAVGTIENLEIIRCSDNALYSAWRPTWRERLRLIFGARLWIGVLSNRQPPLTVLASFWPWKTGSKPGNPKPLIIPGCPTFEHWLDCRLYRTALCAAARLGLITVEEASPLRLDAGTILRREADGSASRGRPFCRARWKDAAKGIMGRMFSKGRCHHSPGWATYP